MVSVTGNQMRYKNKNPILVVASRFGISSALVESKKGENLLVTKQHDGTKFQAITNTNGFQKIEINRQKLLGINYKADQTRLRIDCWWNLRFASSSSSSRFLLWATINFIALRLGRLKER